MPSKIPNRWEWARVECKGGCGKFNHVPQDDPAVESGWTCAACQMDNPSFRPITPTKPTGGPKMNKTPSQKPTGGLCACGCGNSTKAVYSQGHDARHVSKLVAEVLADKRSRSSALRQIDSPHLKEKLRKSLDRAEALRSEDKADADG